ncbi:hypothetical protein BK126_04685 [Paenibacillus sp. FSL H7-0326]|uniref:hypothetical protein n=1 Tax=Paenibacillus sp. FSL H7-0326 TaxID=1921144 RepID=UPI00096EBD24|nr:hypothetical protein [Paenibacillus sp. FSL H7-0326]OMC71396.1 hypothetical protein BK126_04685 [Paenibacillus sp. FSL H7-0326]
MSNKKEILGIGKVTGKGILYEELYYSCDFAIKEKWFEKINLLNITEVSIVSCSNIKNQIEMILPGNNEKVVVCRAIHKNITPDEDLVRYYTRIQELKFETNKIQKKKNQNEIFY